MAPNDPAVRFERSVRGALEGCGLAAGARLVVAVSGGPDSLALLYALSRLGGELGLELHGAHLDHGLRGDTAEADARFVARTLDLLGIPSTVERADVRAFRERHGLSPEEAAREVRYSFLARVARERHAQAVAVAHTSDDQAETVLMHIVRGAGVTGLGGMRPVTSRTVDGRELRVLRPLLGLSRSDTLGYCRALDLRPRMDETNLSTGFSRNRVRIELLPLLEQLNPGARDALLRLSSNARRVREYLDTVVGEVWDDVASQQSGRVLLRATALRGLAPAVRAHLLRRAVETVKGDLDGLEQGHLDDMVRLVDGPAGRTLDLPGGLRFLVGYEQVAVADGGDDRDLCPLPPLEGTHRLAVPGDTTAGLWRVSASILDRDPGQAFQPPDAASAPPRPDGPDPGRGPEFGGAAPDGSAAMTARFGYAAMGAGLSVRGRGPADRFQPLGMRGTKSLQDFMVDARVPRWWRDRVPLVTVGTRVAWVVGWRIAEWARVRESDARLLELRFATTSEPDAGRG